MQDIRYALRSLRRQPMFALVAVLTIALGIGANTAIFSLLYQVLLRPLPYRDPGQLVFVWNTYPLMGLPRASVAIPDYIDRTTQAPGIIDATLFTPRRMNLASDGEPQQVRGLAVTPSFFSTLGRQPAIGRSFLDEQSQPGADKFVILTHTLWRTRFGGEASVVGRDIRLNGESYQVTGVLPADFELPVNDISLLVPYAFTPAQMSDAERGRENSSMIARIAPGVTMDQLATQFKAIIDRNLERLPDSRSFVETSGFGGVAVPLREQLVGDVCAALYLLQAGVLLVLLIACANVASLLLMRATGRHRELAIRTSLGAGQRRLFAQLLTEGLVISSIGAIVGLALGVAGVRGLVALSSQQVPGMSGASVNPAVLGFTMGLAVLTGLIFGAIPGLSVARGSIGSLLNEDSARASSSRSTGFTRAALVVAETALAVVLLIGAGLLIRSFGRLNDVNPGFSPDKVLTAQLALPAARYPDANARRTFWGRLIDGVRTLPGVTAAGLTSNVPFNGNVSSGSYAIVGYTPPAGEAAPHARQEVVGGDYFRAMSIPVVSGRVFTELDTADSQRVVVVDEFLVNRYFKDRDPIGQQIAGSPTPWTIVGVVGTINAIDLGEPVMKERIYYPVAQVAQAAMAVVVKTAIEPRALASQVKAVVGSIDAEQPIADVRTMDEWMERSLEVRRSPMVLLALFGGVALALSAIGIYGVLAFGVAQRSREFGIRQALGAERREILSLVFTQGLRTAGSGVALGLAMAIGLTTYLRSQLFGVGPHDPVVYALVTMMLASVAAAACYIPARRATRVDPAVALRDV
jgi:putative ABC transport system permease protein